MLDQLVVSYCTNLAMSVPMRVSVCALLEHLSSGIQVHFHLVQEGWRPNDIDRLKQLISSHSAAHTLTVHDADLSDFAGFPSLHGDRMVYARLLLPELIDADRVLYIDSDTLPLLDVSQIYRTDLEGKMMGAVSWNVTVSNANDGEALVAEGMGKDEPYFNSGVLVLDTRMFREERLYDQILDTGRRLGKRLITVDQTLINLVLHQRIQPLRWKYNVRLGFDEPPYSGDGLAHFVGALKPWDPFARWLHGNASLWENWAQKAGEGMQSLGQKVSRGIKLGPVYARAWRARLA